MSNLIRTLSNSKVLNSLFNFLTLNEINQIQKLNSKTYKLVQPYLRDIAFSKIQTYLKNINLKTLNKNTINLYQTELILFRNPLEKSYQIDQKNGSQLIMTMCNSKNQQIHIKIQRALIDSTLDFDYDPDLADQDIDYSKIMEDKELNQFDVSDQNQARMRQQLILKKINNQKAKIQDMQNPYNLNDFINLLQKKEICIILCNGGYFSIGHFVGMELKYHTSDHKYVVRGKGHGKRQITKDQSKGISSMGSQIRREQEQHHWSNIKQILQTNKQILQKSCLILLNCPGINYQMLMEETILKEFKDKLRSLAQSVEKANFTCLEKAFESLVEIKF